MTFDQLDDYVLEEDPEYESKLEAQRITAHWRTGGTKVLPDYTKGPLFGSGEQFGMFGESETEG